MNSQRSDPAENGTVKRRLAAVYLIGALVGAVVLVSMVYIYRVGARAVTADAPQLDTAAEITLAVSSAHLWFEEALGGDETTHNMDDVRRWLDSAQACTLALLEGGRGADGPIPPLKDKTLRQIAAEMAGLLADFAALTRQRHERPAESGIGTAVDERYDLLYDDILGKGRFLNTSLRTSIDAKFRKYRVVQGAVIGLCAVMIFTVTLLTRFFVRRRLLDEAGLVAANQQLRAGEQQLRAANQQLHAGEQQLRAANQQLQAGKQQLHAANQQLQATEQQLRAANQQLTVSEHRLRSIIESSPMGMHFYELTDDGRLVLIGANPAADRLTGVHNADLIGKTFEEAFPAVVDTEIPARYRAAAADGTPWQVFSLDYDDGKTKGCFDVCAFQTLPGRMAVIFTEVSPRRQAEIAIENLTARNQAILAAVPDIIAEVDAEKRYTWLNAAGLDFFGEDAVGKAADSYFERPQETYAVVGPLFEGDENIIYVESWQRRKDGQERLLAWWRRGLKDAQGNVAGALSTARDVTEHKLAERELRRLTRTLDARNRELQSIVYAASHDLRSPLVNIQGFGGELAECCSSIHGLMANVDDDEEWSKEIRVLVGKDVPEALGFIRAGARKMQTLLDGLLSVSRAGSVELVIETLDMNALLQSVIAAMQYQIDDRNAEIVVDPLPACRGDAGQINQVFSNLISNALKYASGAGRPRVHVTGTVEEEEEVYCVEDNGIGIAPEHREKIFEIFHRLNPRDTHDGEGIGLTIVSRILDRHDGRVWVESELEKGSRFFVALPKT